MGDENLKFQNEQLRNENTLLLETLHKVQEELEAYYLANNELIAAVRRSESTMLRARSIITRLATED